MKTRNIMIRLLAILLFQALLFPISAGAIPVLGVAPGAPGDRVGSILVRMRTILLCLPMSLVQAETDLCCQPAVHLLPYGSVLTAAM